MAIPEAVVSAVVAHISEQMKDPNFTQLSVGAFVQNQPHVSRFLSAKAAKLGGAEALVQLAFHGQVLVECLERHGKLHVPTVEFSVLDRASQGDFVALFPKREPALASYIASNVEDERLRGELCRVGLALSMAVGR
jgi:hypothetical protein